MPGYEKIFSLFHCSHKRSRDPEMLGSVTPIGIVTQGVGVLIVSFLFPPMLLLASSDVVPGNGPEAVDHILRIQDRQFIPPVLYLRVGQPTRLILKNEDAELHAFVPEMLFVRANVQVSGNGAPQFGNEGFRRVLLPTLGQTELVFAPKQAGSYPFFCDLPGHVMNGIVIVKE